MEKELIILFWEFKNYNMSNKEEIIKEAGIAACKILVTAFKICDLETHIEQMFIDENTGEEFILKFYSKKGFRRFLNGETKRE